MKEETIENELAALAPLNSYVGNDIIFLRNFQDSLTRPFIKKVYTQNEIDYCESFSLPLLRYASTFAAKEAVFKGLKQYDHSMVIPWRSIEVIRNTPAGKPTIVLPPELDKLNISLSITHDGEYVWAIALVTSKNI